MHGRTQSYTDSVTLDLGVRLHRIRGLHRLRPEQIMRFLKCRVIIQIMSEPLRHRLFRCCCQGYLVVVNAHRPRR